MQEIALGGEAYQVVAVLWSNRHLMSQYL